MTLPGVRGGEHRAHGMLKPTESYGLPCHGNHRRDPSISKSIAGYFETFVWPANDAMHFQMDLGRNKVPHPWLDDVATISGFTLDDVIAQAWRVLPGDVTELLWKGKNKEGQVIVAGLPFHTKAAVPTSSSHRALCILMAPRGNTAWDFLRIIYSNVSHRARSPNIRSWLSLKIPAGSSGRRAEQACT